jgi:hypothetical protein
MVILLLVVDSSIPQLSVYTGGLYPRNNYLAFFVVIVLTYAITQQIIISTVKRKISSSKLKDKPEFSILIKAVPIVQYIICILLFCIIFQIIIMSTYSLQFLKATVYMSYTLGFIALAILTYKLSLWYKINHNLLVIAYLVAVGSICLNSILTILSLNLQFDIRPDLIHYARSLTGGFAPGPTFYSYALDITYIFSFVFTWIATGLLLRNMKNRILYWAALGFPVIYIFTLFQPFTLNLFYDSIYWNRSDAGIVYTLFLNSAKPLGAVLFGLAFLYMSRSVNNTEIRNYMIISAYGMMLMFTSNQSTGIIQVPFPPFGLVTIAFFGLASFLFLIGVYSSAISVSQDITIRKYITNYAHRLTFLTGIASSEMENETQKIVKKVINEVTLKAENLENTTGVTSSLQEEDIRDYIKLVTEEAKKSKRQSD